MNTKKFATLLKQKRTTLKYSQSKVAELCFLSKSSYNHLEHGKRFPSLDTLIRLSDILKTDPKELLSAILADENPDEDLASMDLLREDPPEESHYKNSFVNSFHLLTQDEQKAVLDIIDSLISSHTNQN